MAAIVLLIIFIMSSQDFNSSAAVSGRISRKLYNWLSPVFSLIRESPGWLLFIKVDHATRKLAHFFLYYTLTAFIIIGFRTVTARKLIIFSASFLLVLILACIDEFLQSFIDGRTAAATDVLLDLTGAVAAQLTALLAILVRRVKFSVKSDLNVE